MSNCQVPGELTNTKFMRLNFPENRKIFFHDDVLEHLRPLAEKWSKQKLSSDASIFGIRYLTGAWLSLFVAPKEEKTIGVILQVRALSYSLTKASLFFWGSSLWVHEHLANRLWPHSFLLPYSSKSKNRGEFLTVCLLFLTKLNAREKYWREIQNKVNVPQPLSLLGYGILNAVVFHCK